MEKKIYNVYISEYVYYFNVEQGDMSYIKSGEISIIVDIGSLKNNLAYNTISNYFKMKNIKEEKRLSLKEYAALDKDCKYTEKSKDIWRIPCDIALPCATQNELHLEDAKALVANGCKVVAEGANMPTTLEATKYLQDNGVVFGPAKAANAGGVAVSALEMSQNSERLHWTFDEVDNKLETIMQNIFKQIEDSCNKYELGNDYVAGANIAGFEKVAEAMQAQGIV